MHPGTRLPSSCGPRIWAESHRWYRLSSQLRPFLLPRTCPESPSTRKELPTRLRPWEAGRDDASDDSESEVDQDGDQQRQRQRQQPNDAVSVQQLETRLDHDLNRFEMVYPTNAEPRDLADTRMEDQESHIAHLEEENLTLKERLYVMEQEMAELRRRLSSREELDSMDEQAEVCCDSDSRPAASQANH